MTTLPSPGLLSRFGNTYLFTARRFAAKVGIYYYRNRYYLPTSGRFVSADPLAYTETMNRFMYTQNDSVNSRDPSGLISVDTCIHPDWSTWEKPRKIQIGDVQRSGVRGVTTIGRSIAVPTDKAQIKTNADVVIDPVTCKTTSQGCSNGCIRAYGKSAQLHVRPRIHYVRGNRSSAIHEATHARQIAAHIKKKVETAEYSTYCGKPRNRQSLINQCQKQLAMNARTKAAQAIDEWNKLSNSLHALEAGKNDKNRNARYKSSNVEEEARNQAETGNFPAQVGIPVEFS